MCWIPLTFRLQTASSTFAHNCWMLFQNLLSRSETAFPPGRLRPATITIKPSYPGLAAPVQNGRRYGPLQLPRSTGSYRA